MSNSWCVITELLLNSLTLRVVLLRSLKVIGTDTNRPVIYDFILVFPSNFVPKTFATFDFKNVTLETEVSVNVIGNATNR